MGNEVKENMHPGNPHREGYNFKSLVSAHPELALFIVTNEFNKETIDFANPAAVKALNKALLKKFYNIEHWDIPADYLCPPVPGRADYIHYLADLLSESNGNVLPGGKKIAGLDIGTGANGIYPLIGIKEYGWRFVGSDIDPLAIRTVQMIAKLNSGISKSLECRLQKSSLDIFSGIIRSDEYFDFTMCNPPFHSSPLEAASGALRKWKNLGLKEEQGSALNFGGQNTELWCQGGEKVFVSRIIQQSALFSKRCLWFTTLISKKDNLPHMMKKLRGVSAIDTRIINMAQGQKTSRIVAWTFLNRDERENWCKKRW